MLPAAACWIYAFAVVAPAADTLLDDGHRRGDVHLEGERGVRGPGAHPELLPGSSDGLPHRAVHRGRQKQPGS
jgi:hypothetical protein